MMNKPCYVINALTLFCDGLSFAEFVNIPSGSSIQIRVSGADGLKSAAEADPGLQPPVACVHGAANAPPYAG